MVEQHAGRAAATRLSVEDRNYYVELHHRVRKLPTTTSGLSLAPRSPSTDDKKSGFMPTLDTPVIPKRRGLGGFLGGIHHHLNFFRIHLLVL